MQSFTNKQTRRSVDKPTDYEQWKGRALADDERTGAARWRHVEFSRRYDHAYIRTRLDDLRQAMASNDSHQLLYHLSEGVHGNMAGMGSPGLYGRASFGTKDLITTYVETTTEAIQQLVMTDDGRISWSQKSDFLQRASECFGSTALMLSGAGTLGPFHLGVIKALFEQDLLPNVISGASAGSLVCAIVGTRADETLADTLKLGGIVRSFATLGEPNHGDRSHQLGIQAVRSLVESQIPDVTFAEAFELTGRRINISVAPLELKQRSRMLNAITTPQVLIREAVLASCAIPGVFPPVTLMARNLRGKRQSFMSGRQWVDGSVSDDLPSKRLSRLYGVNHFIASQANPVVLWALPEGGPNDDFLSKMWSVNKSVTTQWLTALYPMVMEATKYLHPLNYLSHMAFSIATQEYMADINILPRQRLWDPTKLLSTLTEAQTLHLINEGELATWPKVEQIRNATLIGQTITRMERLITSRHASTPNYH